MFKKIGKSVGRFIASAIGVGVVGVAGYYISMGLNWLTANIMEFLTKAAIYLMGNWGAVIVVIVALIIGNLFFDGIVNSFRRRKRRRTVQEDDDI